ncbi:hypothetical protein ACFWSF_22175 [Streptomyces sp. NPDC058611]|uniref:hypothetical protein n=1 Tax=unclassified Streptomyces TaxID=2593676 RepID=UPI003655D9F7
MAADVKWPQLRSRLLADSPFRELLPFTEQDDAVFHGHGHETRRLLELLGEQRIPVLTRAIPRTR